VFINKEFQILKRKKMAKSQNNVVTHGLSGKIGKVLVFRQVGGKTIVSGMPQMPKTASALQKEQRRRFQQAALYSKAAIESAELGEDYAAAAKKKGRTPYIIAVADFLRAPSIDQVDLSDYTGQTGEVIRIRVSDDFKVKWVHVSITGSDGELVESGEAVPDATGYEWTYTVTQANNSLSGDKIVISVSDTPGNITQEE
jgi:hypothetical protein